MSKSRKSLSNANLQDADLWGSNLQGKNLQDAYLRGADLAAANLRGAYLQGADLRGAYLDGANLDGANLEGANLEEDDLRDANLEEDDLRDANLEGADITGANLRGAKLQGTIYEDADLVTQERVRWLEATRVQQWCAYGELELPAPREPVWAWVGVPEAQRGTADTLGSGAGLWAVWWDDPDEIAGQDPDEIRELIGPHVERLYRVALENWDEAEDEP